MSNRAGEQPIGVAVVGIGYWGPNLVRNFAACADTEVLWVCDLSEGRAASVAKPFGNIRVTTSVEDVLSDERVSALAVATPAATHGAIGLAALDAGKHVLMEKPLAQSVLEAEKLVTAARNQELVLMCDHTYCFSPAVLRMREWIQGEAAGAVRYLESTRVNLGIVQPDVDVFWDLAPHDLAILDFVLPHPWLPEAVWAQGGDPMGVGRPCLGYITLALPDDAIAHLAFNWLSPVKVRTMVVGASKQMLVWDDLDHGYRLRIYDRGVQTVEATDEASRREVLVSYRTGDMVAPALGEVEPLSVAVAEFASAIRNHRPPATPGESGVRVLKVLEAAHRSIQQRGAPVGIDGL